MDVGTDHAMVPVYLAQTGRIRHAWASDVNPGPLQRAQAFIAQQDAQDIVSTRLADGLDGFSAADGDTLILAGMGGETMIGILSAAPWIGELQTIILQPQSRQSLLRQWLGEHSFRINTEKIIYDNGKYYSVLRAQSGVPEPYTPGELLLGKKERIVGEEYVLPYLHQFLDRERRAAPFNPESRQIYDSLVEIKEWIEHAEGIRAGAGADGASAAEPEAGL